MSRQPLLLVTLVIAACPGEIGRHRAEVGVLLVDGAVTDRQRVDGRPAQADQQPPKVDLAVQPPDLPPIKGDSWIGAEDVGKPCKLNSDCQYQICATNTHTGLQFCTKACDRCAPAPCPTGSGCQNAGPYYICAPGYPNAPC
jgi:hypothetical protein